MKKNRLIQATSIIAIMISAMGCIPITTQVSSALKEKIDSVTNSEQKAGTSVAADAVEYSSLTWAIGRDQPTVASPEIVAEIKAENSSASTLYFSWVDSKAAGVALGSKTYEPAELHAYVFFGGNGGFFDFCSVSRISRGLDNANGKNWGWPSVDKSKRPIAFFIGSKDGKTRTNIVEFN